MKKDEFKKWVKEHKKGILIGAGTTAALIISTLLKKKFGDIFWERELSLDLETGCTEFVTEHNDFVEALIVGVKAKDLGKFEKEIAEKLPFDINEDTTFDFILNYEK